MISVMPLIDCMRISSATLNAALIGRRGTSSRSLSLYITIAVSVNLRSLSSPASAFSIRIRPSDLNGIVTTPIVRAPSSFAIRATYWAEPVPVPPPMPAVMNTTWEPRRNSRISSSFSWAACSPTSGRAPAPRPFVRRLPIRIFFGACTDRRCFASVFTAQSWAPVMPASLHRLTVFDPPPPQPTILIETLIDSTIFSISWSSFVFALSCVFAALAASRSSFASASWCRAKAPLTSATGLPRFRGSRCDRGPRGHVDYDAGVRDVERIDGVVVGRALVLLDGDEPLDPGLIPELVQADLATSEERLRQDLGFLRELDGKEGRHLRFGEVAHERLRRHGLLELPHAKVPQRGHRVDHDALVVLLDEEGLEELLQRVDRDLLAFEVRRLSDPLPDGSHLERLLFRGNLQERRRLEPPDVRIRVEDIEVVQVPSERTHVDLQFVRGLFEADKETAFPAFQALPQELHREDRLARAGWSGHDVGPARYEAAVEHLVEAGNAGAHPGCRDHRITGGRGGIATGGGGGASAIRSVSWESQARAIFIAFW